MNKVMPSPSDAVVMNKVASFTSVMVTQINSSHQLPVPPNQLLLNEKVSLSPALYSGGNYSALNPQFMVTQTNSSHQLPVPPNQWLLNEKVPLSPALYSGGNYSALNPQYGYTVSISPVLNSLPEKTIRMGVSKAMPLPSDAVVASKVTSFAPLMFPQISGGQELSSPPNQIPFNGTLSPTQVLSNGSNCLTPQPQYGYPVSTLLNLNSLPEKTVGMDAGKAMPSSSTPMIMEKKRFVQDLLSREVIDLVDESVNKKDKQEIGKWKPLAQKKAERNVPRTIASYSSEHLGPSQSVFPTTNS